MKLPIKKEYFDAIQNGNKTLEFRDAHITFVCESTGRTMRREVVSLDLIDIEDISDLLDTVSPGLFEDKMLIKFELEDTKVSNRNDSVDH